MAAKKYLLQYTLLTIFCTTSLLTNAQKLIQSRKSSYYTYIYKLTDKEAKKIYRKSARIIDTTYFHSLVDSFPTKEEYKGKLQKE